VRKLNRPVVVHIITRKGKGYGYAEAEPDSYHGVGSFSVDGGVQTAENTITDFKKGFTEAFSDCLLAAADKNKKITAITAAMQTGTGLSSFAEKYPERFFDVGIAEEHAVTFASALSCGGLLPVVAIYSTFIQRAVDQVIHDTALQKLPVVFALDRAGFVGSDGETHQGLFDISIFRSTPNMTILAPASENELRLMLNWSLEPESKKQKTGPVIIRYPKAYCPNEIDVFSLPIEFGRGVWITKDEKKDICLAFTGSLYKEVKEAQVLLKEHGINADLYNLRFLKPVDEDYLADIMNEYKLVCFIEEGIRDGGFGEYAAALALRRKCTAEILVMAAENNLMEEDKALGTREELLADNNMDGIGIAKKIRIIRTDAHMPL
jgi:1-deoxy-D-xylulose-5-phosphate synthase